MIYRRTPQFHAAAAALPEPVQAKLPKLFDLFQRDPRHPSLRVRSIQCRANLFEGRVDRRYRFLFEYRGEECWFLDIGNHDLLRSTTLRS
jgi:hypothetical protein